MQPDSPRAARPPVAVSIRSARPADCAAMRDIYNDSVLHSTATYDEEPRSMEAQEAWLQEKRAQGYPVLVAEDEDGRVIGWACLSRFREKPGYRFTAEDSVYVHRDWRGRGVGRALLAALIEQAKGCGFHAIVAGIDAESEASVRLHAAFGFQKVARFPEVGRKFNRWLDVVFMELLLNREEDSNG